MKGLHEESVLLRMQNNIKGEFPIGCRVRMTEAGLRQFPDYKGRLGSVVAYSHGISPKVLWDGRKTASGYAPWFVERITDAGRLALKTQEPDK